MKRLLCLVFFSIAVASAQKAAHTPPQKVWAAEPTSLLGIKFGVPLSESLPKCSENSDSSRPCFTVISDFYSLENIDGLYDVFVREVDGKVAHVSASFHDYDALHVRNGLLLKYGKPQRQKSETVHSKAGVAYINNVLQWNGKYIVLKYESIGTRVDEGSISAYTDAYLKHIADKSIETALDYSKKF